MGGTMLCALLVYRHNIIFLCRMVVTFQLNSRNHVLMFNQPTNAVQNKNQYIDEYGMYTHRISLSVLVIIIRLGVITPFNLL